MPSVHEAGPVFVHTVRLKPGTPLIHRAPTNEVEEPFRRSNSVIFNFFRRGVVLGLWRKTNRDEDQALLDALFGTVIQEAGPLTEAGTHSPTPEEVPA